MLAYSRPCILVVVRDQTLKADIGGFWPVMFVRYWHLADMPTAPANICFRG